MQIISDKRFIYLDHYKKEFFVLKYCFYITYCILLTNLELWDSALSASSDFCHNIA